MTIGSIVRAVSGPFEKRLCMLYRSVFINIRRCMAQIEVAIPHGASVIDVGGGDGEMLNQLLRLRPDLNVVMLDLREKIGSLLDPDIRDRVILLPGTSLATYHRTGGAAVDVVLVSDVIHHVPVEARKSFIADCLSLTRSGGWVIIKDVSPGGLVAMLSVLADRYITGDRHVSLVAPAELSATLQSFNCTKERDLLSAREFPNYAMVFRAPALTVVS